MHASEDALPADFGKYRLEKRIAAGGMAEVFLAHRHDSPHEPLVIKRILPHISQDKNFVQMFTDEARMAANLDHPNVVRILDLGLIDGTYFMAMEYVHGEDIRRIYNRAYRLQRSLPLSHSIRVIADAAQGLAYAHKLQDPLTGEAMGLVHRDVSPQNIIVTYAGDAKVVDFGIAKAAHKVQQTRAGQVKGKYSYMSPEQAVGDPLDHRTDIFALGVILYETTTGTRLFKRQNELATLQAVMKCDFVPPREALPNYPPQLEAILLRALAKAPQARWQDGGALSAALYDFLHDSKLYVEREAVGAFMRELFADETAPASSDGPRAEVAPEPAAGLPAEETRAEGRPRGDRPPPGAAPPVGEIKDAETRAEPRPARAGRAPEPSDESEKVDWGALVGDDDSPNADQDGRPKASSPDSPRKSEPHSEVHAQRPILPEDGLQADEQAGFIRPGSGLTLGQETTRSGSDPHEAGADDAPALQAGLAPPDAPVGKTSPNRPRPVAPRPDPTEQLEPVAAADDEEGPKSEALPDLQLGIRARPSNEPTPALPSDEASADGQAHAQAVTGDHEAPAAGNGEDPVAGDGDSGHAEDDARAEARDRADTAAYADPARASETADEIAPSEPEETAALAETTSGSGQNLDERRKDTVLVRDRHRAAVEDDGPVPVASPAGPPADEAPAWADDNVPTVAAVPSYRPGSAEVSAPTPALVPPVVDQRGPTVPSKRDRNSSVPARSVPAYRPSANGAVGSRPEGPVHSKRTRVAGRRRGDSFPDETQQGEPPPSARPHPVALPRPVAALVSGLMILLLALVGALVVRSVSVEQTSPNPPLAVPPIQAHLTVSTEVGASVWLGERRLGTANSQGHAGPFAVPAGQQRIRVHHPDLGFERERILTLKAKQNYFYEIRGRTGWLRLAVNPWAEVRIDGKSMGPTPLPRIGLLEGTHRLRLENDDLGRFYESTFRIEAGREARVKVDLHTTGDQL